MHTLKRLGENVRSIFDTTAKKSKTSDNLENKISNLFSSLTPQKQQQFRDLITLLCILQESCSIDDMQFGQFDSNKFDCLLDNIFGINNQINGQELIEACVVVKENNGFSDIIPRKFPWITQYTDNQNLFTIANSAGTIDSLLEKLQTNYNNSTLLQQLTVTHNSEEELENASDISSPIPAGDIREDTKQITITQEEAHYLKILAAIFTKLNLKNLNLNNLYLEGVDLSYANLENTNLEQSTLANSNLEHANLTNANFTKAILRYSNARSTIFTNAKIHRTHVKNLDFTNARFYYISLYHSLFSRCTFDHAELTHININEVDFEDTTFKNVVFTLNLEENFNNSKSTGINMEEWVYNLFVHTDDITSNETEKFSIITSIEYISNSCSELKVNLINQIIDFFNDHPDLLIEDVAYAIFEVLVDNHIYHHDSKIILFMIKYMDNKIIEGNSNIVSILPEDVRFFIEALNNDDQRINDFIKNNNGFINQILFKMLTKTITNVENSQQKIQKIIEKYNKIYFTYSSIKKTFIALTDVESLLIPDPEDIIDGYQGSMTYFIYGNFSVNNTSKILVSLKYLKEVIDIRNNPNSDKANGFNWSNLYYFDSKGKFVPQNSLNFDSTELQNAFTILYSTYLTTKTNNKKEKLINELFTMEEVSEDQELIEEFKQKIKSALSLGQFADTDKITLISKFQVIATTVLGKFIDMPSELTINSQITLKPESFNTLIQNIGLSENICEEEQDYVTLCLSAFFIKLSSEYFFGEEYESLVVFRYMAIALINSIHNIDPDDLAKFNEWKRLLNGIGITNTSTCTATIFDQISTWLKLSFAEPKFKTLYYTIIPAQW